MISKHLFTILGNAYNDASPFKTAQDCDPSNLSHYYNTQLFFYFFNILKKDIYTTLDKNIINSLHDT
jgi:hypothetical protein